MSNKRPVRLILPVKAQVNHRDLDAALASQNLTLPQQPPKGWRTFHILDCLNSLHRVLAACEFLDKNDRWWIVRLYTDGEAKPFRGLFSSALMIAQIFPQFALAALPKSTRTKRVFPMAKFSVKSGSTIGLATITVSEGGGRSSRMRRVVSCESR